MIYNLRQFSRPDTLVNLDPQNLLTLLNKYRDYFESGISGIQIPEQIDKEFPFDKLASEFANPVFDGDTKMFEDLALIEQMSRDRYAPVILDFLQNVPYRMDFEAKYQSLNNSLLMFLHDPERLYRIREELKLEDPKSYFIARHMGKKSAFACDDSRIEDFRRKLDDLYAGKKFGRGVTITHHRIPDGDYFLVRKGMPHSYQPTIGKDLSTVGIYFREEVFDIIIFDSERNELKLAINGERKWMRSAYVTLFGMTFCGDESYFESSRKISYRRQQELGAEALKCNPGESIASVTVNYIKLEKYKDAVDLLGESRGCKPCVTEHSIEDFYQNAKDYGIDISNEGDIVGVKLEFHFGPKDSKIIILNYNKCIGLQYDARGLLIEKWLIEHGFIEQ